LPVDAFVSVVGGRRCRPGGATPLGRLRRTLTSPDPIPDGIGARFGTRIAFRVSGFAPPPPPPVLLKRVATYIYYRSIKTIRWLQPDLQREGAH
jgi:hypothetical protein